MKCKKGNHKGRAESGSPFIFLPHQKAVKFEIISNYHWNSFNYKSDVPVNILKSAFPKVDKEETTGFFFFSGLWYHITDFIVSKHIPSPWHGCYKENAENYILLRLGGRDHIDQYQVARAVPV